MNYNCVYVNLLSSCAKFSSHFSDLKKNYQELLLKHHPDKNGGKESEVFLAVDKAWKILGDEKQRAIYDAEFSNDKLEQEQDAAIWMKMKLSDLELDNDIHFYKCRCGGVYQVDVQEVEDVKADGDEDILVDCDTCSLNILVYFT